ncbi:hypothetical protein FRC17_001150 [Serendipita sp. 399]|nr:hypothetical protein FRC17_001150 [Serendipita sp. 399]
MYSLRQEFSSTGDLTATPPSASSSSVLHSPRNSLFFDDDYDDATEDETVDPSSSSSHFCIYLTTDDPTETVFVTSNGQRLYKSKSFMKTYDARPCTATMKTSYRTRVVRLYGKTARAVKEASERRRGSSSSKKNATSAAAEGLVVAEMEWLERTRSSRIRFGRGAGSSRHDAVDVRIDEFLKNTKGR